ncbi:PREDICTED: uncharacterized protein LOC105562425 [Vollenhovia emeryi]|uniref:uncharacterized protein LOC105562425 n=1 Tax=Vollenhovia emeryi TaxID=411798 RepID=UPI0005F56402|nr:PREDICTED: uncharacterized protein LOC105562425 [Vollenhovia emeryi]
MSERSCSIVTNGHNTDIILRPYSNRTLLIVTHFKKLGTFVTVNRESAVNGYNSDVFTIKTVFGSDNNDVHLAARYIAQQINIEKELLLSIALKDYDLAILKSIVVAVNQIKSW